MSIMPNELPEFRNYQVYMSIDSAEGFRRAGLRLYFHNEDLLEEDIEEFGKHVTYPASDLGLEDHYPPIVLLVFALELYLKAINIVAQNENFPNTHNLNVLFKNTPKFARQDLEKHYRRKSQVYANARVPKFSVRIRMSPTKPSIQDADDTETSVEKHDISTFESALAHIAEAFNDFRYIYEAEKALKWQDKMVDFTACFRLMDSARSVLYLALLEGNVIHEADPDGDLDTRLFNWKGGNIQKK